MEGTREDCIRWLLSQPADKQYKVDECRKKRSLNANAYFYVLVNKIAAAANMSDVDVHDKLLAENLCYIMRDGVLEWMVSTRPANKFRLLREGTGYWYDSLMRVEMSNNGPLIDKRTGEQLKGIVYWRVKGSHEMDSKEMARLIESTIQEAKQLDIETLTPAELDRMLSMWKGERNE